MLLKKKMVNIAVIAILSTGALVGCSSEENNTSTENKNNTQIVKEDKEAPVLIKELEFVDNQMLEPDSIGTRYYVTKFKNNSDKIITNINIELELDNGETTYLSSHDVIKPGDTSAKTQCFGPSTGNLEDMKAKVINIVVIDKNKQYYIDYDIKLDKYDVLETKYEENKEVSPVAVKEIEFVNPTVLDPDSIGNVYFKTQFKNNSKLPITSVSIEFELDNGETTYLTSFDTLLPGDTSSNAECFGPSTGNLEDMKAKTISIVALNEDKKDVYIDYNIKLNKYDIIVSTN